MVTEVNDNENTIIFVNCNSETTEEKIIFLDKEETERAKITERIVVGNMPRVEVERRKVDENSVIFSDELNFSSDFQFNGTNQVDFNVAYENKSISVTNQNGKRF